MGIDFADIDRDGHDDLLVVDMLSREHQRRLSQRGANGHDREHRSGYGGSGDIGAVPGMAGGYIGIDKYMRGTWDATNILNAPVAVVTNVELDHFGTYGSNAELAEAIDVLQQTLAALAGSDQETTRMRVHSALYRAHLRDGALRGAMRWGGAIAYTRYNPLMRWMLRRITAKNDDGQSTVSTDAFTITVRAPAPGAGPVPRTAPRLEYP